MTVSDKVSFFALGISVLTFFFSWYSFSKTDELSTNAFNRNYRPYVIAGNFAYIDQRDGKFYPNMNVLLIKILNAPALVTNQQLSFYIRENGNDSILFSHPEYKDQLFYPLDNNQNTIDTDEKTISDTLARKIFPQLLIRKVRIEYQWISDSTLKYFFQSEWKYNLETKNWDIIAQSAN